MPAILVCQRCQENFLAKRSDAKWCPECRIENSRERAKEYDLHSKGVCGTCGKEIVRGAKLCLSCSNKTRRGKYTGENNPNWKKGITQSGGYIYERVLGETRPGGAPKYKGQHILVWEAANGPLPSGYIVHHLNGIGTDNRLENLFAASRKDHGLLHSHAPYKTRIRELEAHINVLQLSLKEG